MIFPEVLGPVNEEDVENHLVKLTNRLIKDINIQFAYKSDYGRLVKDPSTLLIHYNEVRCDLNVVIYNIKCAMGRLSEDNFIQTTLAIIVKELENIGYLVIHPSLTFNSETLGMIIDKTMNTIRTNFIQLVDLSDNPQLPGDNATRREVITFLNDFLLILERTNLLCPAINIYDEEVTIAVSRTESIKQIKFSEEHYKKFFFEIVRTAVHSLHDIIYRIRRSMYCYNYPTRAFLNHCAESLNTGSIDFQIHLTNIIKSKDDKMYASIKREILKFFSNCDNVYKWILRTAQGSNLKYESYEKEEESDEEENVASARASGARALEEVDKAILDEQKIINALILANSREADELSQEYEITKALKAKCTIGDVHAKFEDSESIAFRELQRRLSSDYVLLSRRFVREINVLFDIVNKICIRKLRFNKQNCNCEVCRRDL